jgi:hypothetical protein
MRIGYREALPINFIYIDKGVRAAYSALRNNEILLLAGDGRIDFVFMKKSSGLRVTAGRELFTDQSYGRVSDHTGYLLDFRRR